MATVIEGDDGVIRVINDQQQTIVIAGAFSSLVNPAAIATAVQDYIVANPIVTGYVHIQSSAAATWIITHPLGRKPNVAIYDSSNVEVESDVVASTTTVTITFPSPMTGQAILT